MKFKALATSALVGSLSFAPVGPLVAPARADTGDVVAGLIIGGIMGAAINENSKKKTTTTKKSTKSKSKTPSMSAEQRAQNVEVQQSLNYFGWHVGSADGVLGNKSKAAISEFQAFLGQPATGALTDEQRMVLVTAKARAEAGGGSISQIVAGSVYGLRGVLLAQRDEMRGNGNPVGVMASSDPGVPAPGAVAAAAAAALPVLLPEAPAAAPVVAAAEPVAEAPPVVAAAPAAPALPSFMDPNGAKGALSAECNRVTLAANANGGYVTVDRMTDANAALAEQFCLTRVAAISAGQDLTARIAGTTAAQIAEQCAAFGPVLKEQVAALSLRPVDEVLAQTEAFILNSGMAPAQLSGTAKVCLGVGYETDSMDVAIGSALLLTAMGETGYAELLGHHLSQGFGATVRSDLAAGWYDVALGPLKSGTDVFMPGAAGREALIRKAAYTISGRAWELAPQPEVQEAALPTFLVTPEAPAAAVAVTEVAPVAPTPVPAAAAPAAPPDAAPVTVPVTAEAAPLPDLTPAPAADLALESAPAPAGPVAEAMRTGSDAAMSAARLPFLLFLAN